MKNRTRIFSKQILIVDLRTVKRTSSITISKPKLTLIRKINSERNAKGRSICSLCSYITDLALAKNLQFQVELYAHKIKKLLTKSSLKI